MNTLFDEMKLLSEVSFRDIYKRYIYIVCRELLDEMLPREVDKSITGMVAYCYIDENEGLSLRPAQLARVTADSMQVFTFPHQEDTLYIIRIREDGDESGKNELHDGDRHMYLYGLDPGKHFYFDISLMNVDMKDYADFKDMIDEHYDPDGMVEEMRSEKFAFLDQYRHPSYPDDVQVIVYRDDIGGEQVWVRLSLLSKDDEMFGILLNEPYNDYGCHEGDMIEIAETEGSDESFLYFTGRIAERRLS